MKQYRKNNSTTFYVSFNLLGENNKIIQQHTNAACFGAIFNKITNKAKTIVVYHQRNMVPYDDNAIGRFIYDLNEMGFPCTHTIDHKYLKVRFKLQDYKYKAHILSALTIIRVLWETGLCGIPETYFQIMDDNPNADKFDVIQTAHKKIGGMSYGHMITYSNNGINEKRINFFNKCAASGLKVYDTGYPQIHQKWNGGIKPKFDNCKDCKRIEKERGMF